MRRPDGLLNHNVLGEDKGPQDACGVFGVWAPGEEVAKLSFYGLYALQHRGTESAGIATSDGERILIFKDMGLVSQVFTEGDLATLKGNLAIGHCRYSTTGSSTWVNAQPTLRPTKYGTLALAHNGNLTNTGDLAELVQKLEGSATSMSGVTTDTEIMTALIALQDEKNVEASALAVLPQLEGAFSLVFMAGDRILSDAVTNILVKFLPGLCYGVLLRDDELFRRRVRGGRGGGGLAVEVVGERRNGIRLRQWLRVVDRKRA